MPFAKAYGPVAGFGFAFLSMVLFDLITGKVGMWTWITAATYGLVGLGAAYWFKVRASKRLNYLSFAIVGTLFFDAVTGLSIGPLFFGQSFMEALLGQIPFTAWHLLGNASFALVLSPALYKFVIDNQRLESSALLKLFNLKKI